MDSNFTVPQLPPHNLEAEESILSTILLHTSNSIDEIFEILKPEHFYKTAHQKIFSAIKSLHSDHAPIDLVTVANKLKSLGQLDECGGGTFLAHIVENIPISLDIEYHARIIIDKAAKRQAIFKCHDIAKACFEDSEPASAIIDRAQGSMLSLESSSPNVKTYKPISEILMDSFEAIDERYMNKGQLTGIPTGFNVIDQLTWGLQKTDLIIIAARPSIGKSSWCLNAIRHAAVNCDPAFPCGIFSLEMSEQQLSFKLLADLAKINTQKFKSGMFSKEDWSSLSNAAGKLNQAPIFIDDSSGLTLNEIRSRSRQMVKKNDVKLIMVDYLQLMQGTENSQNRNLELDFISGGLKRLAKELDIPVVAVSQLNRKVEERNNKRPVMSDLRDSGGLEQNADVIAFLYRDEYYNKADNNPLKGMGEFIISKNRTGPTGIAHMAFVDKYASFYNLSQNEAMKYEYANEIKKGTDKRSPFK